MEAPAGEEGGGCSEHVQREGISELPANAEAMLHPHQLGGIRQTKPKQRKRCKYPQELGQVGASAPNVNYWKSPEPG